MTFVEAIQMLASGFVVGVVFTLLMVKLLANRTNNDPPY